MSSHNLINQVTADILSDDNKRILALLPVMTTGGDVVEVAVAYAYRPDPDSADERYFAMKAKRTVALDYVYFGDRREFTTARQAVECGLYANGFGGKTPTPIKVD